MFGNAQAYDFQIRKTECAPIFISGRPPLPLYSTTQDIGNKEAIIEEELIYKFVFISFYTD